MIYYILFVLILIFGILDFYPVEKVYKLFFVGILALSLILIGGLRWETGTDWDSYYVFFYNNVTYTEFVNSEFEFLYALLSFISKTFINSYTFFLLVFCSLTISIKIYGFCKLSGYNFIFLTILMYYANQLGDISATRQSLALSFGVLGLIFIVMCIKPGTPPAKTTIGNNIMLTITH